MTQALVPTRLNLLACRNQVRLARQGVELLKRKKDGLLHEFFASVATVCELRARLTETLRRELTAAVLAQAIHGSHTFATAADATTAELHVELTPRRIWGVPIIEWQHTYRPQGLAAGPASPRSTPLAVDEVAAGFEQIVRDLLDLAPRDLRLRRIGEEIRRTNRRINALEQHVIPSLDSQIRRISRVLEERARDDVLRLKRLKQKPGMSRPPAAS